MPPPRRPADFDALLRGVSRSFYLSVRLLPPALRRPVALGYLLARATDTVADTAAAPVAQRQGLLAALAAAISEAQASAACSTLLQAFAPLQSDPAEQALILRVDEALAALGALPAADRSDVQAVLRHIVHGQALDLQRFPGDTAAVHALPDAAALHEYTYLVAGCVGEFWTDLSLRHVAGYARLPARQMRTLGRSFGCGLQLVNIVRDAGADLADGRCYFPRDELAAAGLAPEHIAADPQRFMPVWHRWQAAAAAGMEDGLAYALAVEPRRQRLAAALPALLGARTLALLRHAGVQGLQRRVKVPRREVHAVLARTLLSLANRGVLQSQFDRLAGPPQGGWDNPRR